MMPAKLLGLSAFAAGFLLESGLQMEMYACRAKTLSESYVVCFGRETLMIS